MAQILSPTRIMPGGLRFVDSNIAVDRMNVQAGQRRAEEEGERRTKRHEWDKEDREIQKKRDKLEADTINEEFAPPPMEMPSEAPQGDSPPPAPPTPIPAPQDPPIPAMQRTPSSRSFSSPQEFGLIPAAMTISEPIAPRPGAGLSTVSSAPPVQAAPPPATMPKAPSAEQHPDVIGVTDGYETDLAEPAAAGGMEEIKVSASRPQGLNVVRSTNPYVDFQRKLAQRYAQAGLGREAMTAYQGYRTGEQSAEDADWKRAIDILDRAEKGDVNGAILMAQRYGEDIPPEVLANGELRRVSRMGLEYAKTYGATHDPAWIQKFTETLMQTGSEQKALTAAGQPVAKPKQGYRPLGFTMTPAGDLLDRDTGKVTRGAGTPRTGGSASQPREITLFNWMTTPINKGGRGMKPEDAEKLIWNVKSNPGAKVNAIAALTRQYASPTGGMMEPAAARKQAVEDYNYIEQQVLKGEASPDPAEPDPDADEEDPDAAGVETTDRIYAGAENEGDEPTIYSDDGGVTWYNVKDDTRYDEGE